VSANFREKKIYNCEQKSLEMLEGGEKNYHASFYRFNTFSQIKGKTHGIGKKRVNGKISRSKIIGK
jgi:hypothetical protein